VPATVLLSNLYSNWLPIAYGVNVGGNGTLIASFANLITLRLSDKKVSVGRFLLIGIVVYVMHLVALAAYLFCKVS
jgi:Na+/H+ antiporter NhaD/arsenite permease-like protein